MRFLWVSFLKDMRRAFRDPISLLLSVGIPVVVGSLLSLVAGGSNGPAPKAELLVTDQDNSFVSGVFLSAFNQGPLADLIEVSVMDEDRALKLVNEGDASAFLMIPEGFGQAVLDDLPMELVLRTNPSQTILPAIVTETLGVLVDGTFLLQRTLLNPLSDLDLEGNPQDFALIGTRLEQVFSGAMPYLNPPIIELEIIEAKEPQKNMSFGTVFLPGLLIMALLFAAQNGSSDVWKEHEKGTLTRTLTTPGRLTQFISGKVLANTVVLLLIGVAFMFIAMLFFGLEVANFPLAVGWLALTGAVLYLLFLLTQVISSNSKGGNIITNALVFPFAMIGGSFFPFEVMPSGLAAIGKQTPNGWALVKFKGILSGSMGPETILPASVIVLVAIAILFSLCQLRISRGFVGR